MTPVPHQNPVPWLLWLILGSLVVISTRNPYYLLLTFLSVLAVYLSIDKKTQLARAWKTILKIGLVIASISIGFNLLTVHSGDRRFGHIPDAIPIIGGPLTLNALIYGLISALALMTLLLVAATFSAAVDRAALVSMIPQRFQSVALALIIAISIFPQTLHSLRDVRDAQRSRGFKFRSIRDLRAIIIPVLNLGLQRGFDLAETIYTRQSNARISTPAFSNIFLIIGFAAMLVGIILFALGSIPVILSLLLGVAGIVAIGVTFFSSTSNSRKGETFRPVLWSIDDIIQTTVRTTGIVTIFLTIVLQSDTLAFTPYPWIEWPVFSLVPAIVCISLITPITAIPATSELARST